MENESPNSAPVPDAEADVKGDPEFKRFATKRIVLAIVVTLVLIWGAGLTIGFFQKPSDRPVAVIRHAEQAGSETSEAARPAADETDSHGSAAPAHSTAAKTAPAASGHAAAPASTEAAADHQEAEAAAGHGASAAAVGPPGVAFTEALIGPLRYDVKERFWGWRPNDIINVTDNVNNIQLGVLEVTRRATIELAERISRTGSTASFDPHLERAMNWLMVKATEYWFPSAEAKYKDAIAELALYRDRLQRGEANFFTRADNLIPLLAAFEDLLGACDENLVKQFEEDGERVSTFRADNYFYYAQGVAIAMLPIMEAVAADFHSTLENRNGVDVIHHAIHSLTLATEIKPWLITEADLDGILANHRANMAAPISHARFYISVLINTLST